MTRAQTSAENRVQEVFADLESTQGARPRRPFRRAESSRSRIALPLAAPVEQRHDKRADPLRPARVGPRSSRTAEPGDVRFTETSTTTRRRPIRRVSPRGHPRQAPQRRDRRESSSRFKSGYAEVRRPGGCRMSTTVWLSPPSATAFSMSVRSLAWRLHACQARSSRMRFHTQAFVGSVRRRMRLWAVVALARGRTRDRSCGESSRPPALGTPPTTGSCRIA